MSPTWRENFSHEADGIIPTIIRSRWTLILASGAVLATLVRTRSSPGAIQWFSLGILVIAVGVLMLIPFLHRRRPPARDYLVPSAVGALPPVFVGRKAEMDELDTILDGANRVRVAVIAGPNGIGKTALAAVAATRLASRYPGGTLFGDMSREPHVSGGQRDDDRILRDVLGVFITGLGRPDLEVPVTLDERAALFRALAARHRPVVVLDDADDPELVRRLLPDGAGCAVLVTTANGAAFEDCGWPVLPLEPLAEEPSMDLIRAMVSETWVDDDETCRRIVRAMHGHPNALRLTATQLASRSGSHADAIRRIYSDPATTLSALRQRRGHGAAVTVALQVSYNLLGDDERRGLRLIGCLDRTSFPLSALAPLTGTDETETQRVVDRLLVAGFLSRTSTDPLGVPVYRVSEDVLLFARQKFQEESKPDDRARLLQRRRREPAPDIAGPIAAARARLEAGDLGRALATARRAVELARATGDERMDLALATLAEVRVESGVAGPLRDFVPAGLIDDPAPRLATYRAHRCAAVLAMRCRDEHAARRSLAWIVDNCGASEPDEAEELVLALLQTARLESRRNVELGRAAVEQADRICATLPDEGIDLRARLYRAHGRVYGRAHQRDEARWAAHEAERWALRRGQHLRLAWIAYDRAKLAQPDASSDEAFRYARDALYAFSDMEHRYGRGRAALLLAELHWTDAERRPAHADGHRRRAQAHWQVARDELSECGDDAAERTRQRFETPPYAEVR
ncbi:hypothetical protein KZ829_27630 [Actinoplanes hulinensis]|uniref:AAA+ ATPase domain-containing protein n=1 Tax=Actinoplanes hulinensis TaxID=1144547 RepID=A0ABS7B983_9ACTN|nr:AAA family ATPase [Actinoplanes hulinensis]MBW6437510.1 hypothetical protein [Actinoplanes hulinensis]